MENNLFVLGLPNTGTSTLVGMLNSHADILICYETWSRSPYINTYNLEIISQLHDLRSVYYGKYNIKEAFEVMYDILKKNGHNYRYVGDKCVNFTISDLWDLNEVRAIYITRPLDEWLLKYEVRNAFASEFDIVSPAIHYLRSLNAANSSCKFIRVTLGEVMLDPSSFLKKVSSILNVDSEGFNFEWWNSYEYDDNLKAAMKWFDRHPSSLIPNTVVSDIHCVRSGHDFWKYADEILGGLMQEYCSGYDKDVYDIYDKKISILENKFGCLPTSKVFKNYVESRHGRSNIQSPTFENIPINESLMKRIIKTFLRCK